MKKRRRGSRSLPRSSRFQSNHLLDDNTHFLIAFKNTLLLLFYQKKKDQVQTVTHWEHFNTPANYPGTLYLIVLPWSDVLEWNVYTMAYGVVKRLMYHKSCILQLRVIFTFLFMFFYDILNFKLREYQIKNMVWYDSTQVLQTKAPALCFWIYKHHIFYVRTTRLNGAKLHQVNDP